MRLRHRQYRLHSDWIIQTAPPETWRVMVSPPLAWHEWWPELREMSDLHLTPELSGSSFSCSWQAPLGYKLNCHISVGEVVVNQKFTLHVSGDLSGEAVCTLSKQDRATHIHIDWRVETTKLWMNFTAPLLSPLFVWAHHAVMRSGERGLRKHIVKLQKAQAK